MNLPRELNLAQEILVDVNSDFHSAKLDIGTPDARKHIASLKINAAKLISRLEALQTAAQHERALEEITT